MELIDSNGDTSISVAELAAYSNAAQLTDQGTLSKKTTQLNHVHFIAHARIHRHTYQDTKTIIELM